MTNPFIPPLPNPVLYRAFLHASDKTKCLDEPRACMVMLITAILREFNQTPLFKVLSLSSIFYLALVHQRHGDASLKQYAREVASLPLTSGVWCFLCWLLIFNEIAAPPGTMPSGGRKRHFFFNSGRFQSKEKEFFRIVTTCLLARMALVQKWQLICIIDNFIRITRLQYR